MCIGWGGGAVSLKRPRRCFMSIAKWESNQSLTAAQRGGRGVKGKRGEDTVGGLIGLRGIRSEKGEGEEKGRRAFNTHGL